MREALTHPSSIGTSVLYVSNNDTVTTYNPGSSSRRRRRRLSG
jgi:hypothetical protein